MAGEFSPTQPAANALNNHLLSQYKATYDELGYVILPSPTLLSPNDLVTLREAAERIIDKTRAGEWTKRRIVGKQFPPFETEEERPDVWGVQHIMHYELGEPAFAQWYGNQKSVQTMAFLLGCEENEVQMGKTENSAWGVGLMLMIVQNG